MKELLYEDSGRPWTPEALLCDGYTFLPSAPTKHNTGEERHFLLWHHGSSSGQLKVQEHQG